MGSEHKPVANSCFIIRLHFPESSELTRAHGKVGGMVPCRVKENTKFMTFSTQKEKDGINLVYATLDL